MLAKAGLTPEQLERCARFAELTQGGWLLNCAPSVVETWPAVQLEDGPAFRLVDERLQNTAWVGHAYDHSHAVLAVLDSAVEAPGWELMIVVSGRGEAGWLLLDELRKPYYLATFSRLEVSRERGFCITIELADDYGAGVEPGSYVSCSTDRGTTWSQWSLQGT